mgnify:CR=1 FL=1
MKTTKAIILLLLLSLSGCILHVEDDSAFCGYDDQPYVSAPLYCEFDSWHGDCCTWVTEGHYDVCETTWCYDEYSCGWYGDYQFCYPI